MGKYYQKVLTKKLSPILNYSGIGQLTKSFYSGKGQILMLHRVIPWSGKERIHNHLSLEISPERLVNIIEFFKKKDYSFISLDELPAWLENNYRTSRKFVIFTFDDGYKDNLDFAYPVLKKHNVPFTIYITSSFPDRKAIIWWYILEDLILRNNKIQYTFSSGSVNINCQNYIKKEKAFACLRGLITQLDDKNLENELAGFFFKYGFSVHEYNNELTLSWNSISQLSKDPLVIIGAHTLNHYNLCSLSDEQSYHEIIGSKNRIEAKINYKIKHFSYPLGKYGTREMEFVNKSNYLTATTIKTANVFYNHVDHLFALPRISINALTDEMVLNLMVKGFYPAILHKFKRIIY
ncbi:MAG: polysaccharide deacetylase family protein [bacterium]